MAVKPRLKPDVRYYQTKKVSEYFDGDDPGISKTAFVRLSTGMFASRGVHDFNLLRYPKTDVMD